MGTVVYYILTMRCNGNMNLEAIANGPIVVELEDGTTQKLCRCGLTEDSPYCDDSHHTFRKGMAPISFNDESKELESFNFTTRNITLYQDIYGDEYLILEDCCTGGGNCSCHQ